MLLAVIAASAALGRVRGPSVPGPVTAPNSAVSGAVDPGSPAGDRAAPGFTLRNQFGQSVSLAQLRGKVVILAFVDSQCTTICPLTSTELVDAKQMLGPAGAQVALVLVNANPKAASVADVAAYSQAHGMANQWDFLTGNPAQLAAVWRSYGVYVAVSTSGIDHEPVIYLIDQRGNERTLYMSQMAYGAVDSQAGVIAHAVAALLPGHPPVAATSAGQAPIGPAQSVSLSSATGGAPVPLGPAHPHLVVFFDTWLAQTSNLTAELEALNSYAARAKARGWPSLVAVDEAPVEAGPGALTALLRRLPVPLSYPVVVDTTGAVADGYQVADQPWLTLTSAQGKTLFSHDGWLSAAALDTAVTKAVAASAGAGTP